MKRSILKTRPTILVTCIIINLCKNQRNYIVNLNRKAKRSFFQSKESNSKEFWTACKPFVLNKSLAREKIDLLDDHNKLIFDDKQIVNIFNSYFVNISNDLHITPWGTLPICPNIDLVGLDDITNHTIKKDTKHPSVGAISSKHKGRFFCFLTLKLAMSIESF